jgi:hypothetical protein
MRYVEMIVRPRWGPKVRTTTAWGFKLAFHSDALHTFVLAHSKDDAGISSNLAWSSSLFRCNVTGTCQS